MPDDIKISALTNVTTLSDTAVFPMVQDLNGTDTTLKASMSQVAGKVAEGTTFVNLTTTAKDLVGAINEAASTGGSVDITTEITTPASVMTFSDGGDNIPLKSLVTEIVPIQEGSGTPSPSNVRAISGHESVKVFSSGKNIYPLDYSHESQTVSGITFLFNDDGSVEMTGTATANTYPYAVQFRLPAGTYKKSSLVNDIGILVQYIASSSAWTLISAAQSTEFTITPEISQYPIVARVRVPSGKVLDHYKYYPFIYVGSETDLTFEKYIGQIKTIPLGQTVYGGSLECVEGEGTNDYLMISENDFANYGSGTTSGGLNYVLVDIAQPMAIDKESGLSNMLPISQSSWSATSPCFELNVGTSPNRFAVRVVGTFSSLADFKTQYSGLQICYKSATPTSLSVSGANIPTLSGVNNIYTDCGDIQSLEYFNNKADDIAALVRLMTRT